MKRHSFKSGLLSLMALCSMALTIGSCANDDVAQNPQMPNDDKNLTTFAAGTPTTRTSMESDGKFFWEAGDKIYVKDDNGAWHASSNSPTGKTDNFKFKVPGTYTAHTSYEVYYPGQGGSNDQAVIAASQSQAEPNTTTHFGAAGDCGMATATKVSGKQQFAFTLDHKAAYLLFLPRTSNTILNKCYLTKVEVNSDNDITSTYTLDPTTGELTGTGTGKQIVLTTKGSGTYANGFPLTNNSTSAATNGSYVVIKPGTHTLKIRYWVKDIATNVEGTITKILSSATYDQNKYYNITANLDVKDYDGDHYYMWDAQEQYWKGYEWNKGGSQPTLNWGRSNVYAKSNTDSRYYNESYLGSGISNPATHSCANLPNINELTWYAAKGNPCVDSDELWTTMGHLYKTGLWIKKKSKIISDEHITAAYMENGFKNAHGTYVNWKNTFAGDADVPADIAPKFTAVPNKNDYFYLPATGFYENGRLYATGDGGNYWSADAVPTRNTYSYGFRFYKEYVNVQIMPRTVGRKAQSFE